MCVSISNRCHRFGYLQVRQGIVQEVSGFFLLEAFLGYLGGDLGIMTRIDSFSFLFKTPSISIGSTCRVKEIEKYLGGLHIEALYRGSL